MDMVLRKIIICACPIGQVFSNVNV